jgi:four helix bundle protein
MPKIDKFEDLTCWKTARTLFNIIHKEIDDHPFCKDFILRDQLRRASLSVMANISEGFGRRTDKEFANFLNIALASITEIQSHLYAALDLNYISETKFNEIYDQTVEVAKLIHGLINYLRRK